MKTTIIIPKELRAIMATSEDFRLGVNYQHGIGGFKKDTNRATHHYRKAAEQGLPDGQFKLGHAYWHGEGVEEDLQQAIYWLRKAAEQGHALAQTRLGTAYFHGLGGIEKNEEKAEYWWAKGAREETNQPTP